MVKYYCERFTNTRAPNAELSAEYSIRMFPPFAQFKVYGRPTRITRTLPNAQCNFQSRESEAATAPNRAWEMGSGMARRGVFRLVDPPVIPPEVESQITWNVEVSRPPAFANARARAFIPVLD